MTSLAQRHHHQSNRAVRRIASELVQYIWDHSEDGAQQQQPIHPMLAGSRDLDELGKQTNVKVVLVAMQHQQIRADVSSLTPKKY